MSNSDSFRFSDERFADIQMLRYRLNGFEKLTLKQKTYIYFLSLATLAGRDIITDQQCRHNLRIRKTLEAIYASGGMRQNPEMMTYLKQVWFANGIHHHYSCDKFVPAFSQDEFIKAVEELPQSTLPMRVGESIGQFINELIDIIFNPATAAKRVNLACDEDLLATSACNYYNNVTQNEAEEFYNEKKIANTTNQPSYGLNSKLIKDERGIVELPWTTYGLYAKPLRVIVNYLRQAKEYAENDQQKHVIDLLVSFYETGDLITFDDYSIAWLKELEGTVDFINGFIEVYGDPLGIKGSWEGLVEYKDLEATHRCRIISDNAQWFEDHSPVDSRFKKKKVTGVSASVICAAMLGGDEYPASAIGINLPNADWIRAAHGSKSVRIGNLTEAYNMAALGNGFYEEFILDEKMKLIIQKYGGLCDDLHTDLHECLGHGSGQLLPTTDPDALRSYGSTIEEARADLFALYYLADTKLLDLGILPHSEAYHSQYYTYLMNGLMTQAVRIKPGSQIEEAHMRNRALIANWTLEHAEGCIDLKKIEGKTYLHIHDYVQVRQLFARLLAEIQRIKSEGDYEGAKTLVEKYGVELNPSLHQEVLERYEKLGIAPYKGFINPRLKAIRNEFGDIIDIEVDYTEGYSEQMMRYSKDFGFL